MRTIRRLYFYVIAFIGLEVVMWSLITLARTLFDAATLINIGDQISGGLAFLIVGLPIFLFHWGIVQKDAARDPEERSSRLREVFLYGVFLATLIPITQNVIALINRPLLTLFELENNFSFLGSDQTLPDNLVAIFILGVGFLYFQKIVKEEWSADTPGNDLPGTRRLFRNIFMVYSLVLLVIGVNSMLQYIFFTPIGFGNPTRELLANGLALTLVAAPLWAFNWLVIQRSLSENDEHASYLRLVVLYGLALIGIISTLFSMGTIIAEILDTLLQQKPITLGELFNQISSTLALTIPMGVIWAYFGREWNAEINLINDLLKRAALRRLYFYILSLLGNIAVFLGVQSIFGVIIDILSGQTTGLQNFAGSLSNSLAMLIIGVPLWIRYWPGLQVEAAQVTEFGDHARRSIIRKSYLYLALFSLVVGMMASAGMLLYNLFSMLFIEQSVNPIVDIFNDVKTLAVVIIWLVYHFLALRSDNKTSLLALSNLHTAFPVAIFQDNGRDTTSKILEHLQLLAPNIPAQLIHFEKGLPIDLNKFKAIVLASDILFNENSDIQIALKTFQGKQLVIPMEKGNLIWQGIMQYKELQSAKETARIIRLMAEGQVAGPPPSSNPWVTIGYILGGLFGLQILFLLVALIGSSVGGF